VVVVVVVVRSRRVGDSLARRSRRVAGSMVGDSLVRRVVVGDSLVRRVVVGDSLVHLDPDRDPCPCLLVAELLGAELAPPLAPVPYPKRRSVSTPCAQSASVLGDAAFWRGAASLSAARRAHRSRSSSGRLRSSATVARASAEANATRIIAARLRSTSPSAGERCSVCGRAVPAGHPTLARWLARQHLM